MENSNYIAEGVLPPLLPKEYEGKTEKPRDRFIITPTNTKPIYDSKGNVIKKV